MYYDRELAMIQDYHEELLADVRSHGRDMTALEFKKACARVWAADEIISILTKEDESVNVLLHEEAPYSVALLVQCFMFDMAYCIHICRNPETVVVWQCGHSVGREILERLKAMP